MTVVVVAVVAVELLVVNSQPVAEGAVDLRRIH